MRLGEIDSLAELGVSRACVVCEGEALVTVYHDVYGTLKRNGVTLLWIWITDLSLVSS